MMRNATISPPLGKAVPPIITRENQLWAGGTGGLVAWSIGDAKEAPYRLMQGQGVRALAANKTVVAVATTNKLQLYKSGSTPYGASLRRAEWITDVATARGGPIPYAVGALAFDRAGTLYMNTAGALTVRTADGIISTYTGMDGLPCANGTALAISEHPLEPGAAQVWIGCARGLAVVDLYQY